MHSLKDNNPKVYKIFSKGNLVIWRLKIENEQDWHPIHLLIKEVVVYNEVP